jgi:ATP-dependent DNA helicase RecG
MKRETREQIMTRFREGRIDVLVATTVIEVGVDVPNATMMVVEHAERFGLAQLHQLRGRIGRGGDGHRSVCAFIAEPTTEEATNRMQAIGSTSDGFKIAEHDLNIRGMGDFFGTRQHGLPPLRVASIPADLDLLQLAKRDAEKTIEADPTLADPSRQRLRKALIRQYGDALGLIDVG